MFLLISSLYLAFLKRNWKEKENDATFEVAFGDFAEALCRNGNDRQVQVTAYGDLQPFSEPGHGRIYH